MVKQGWVALIWVVGLACGRVEEAAPPSVETQAEAIQILPGDLSFVDFGRNMSCGFLGQAPAMICAGDNSFGQLGVGTVTVDGDGSPRIPASFLATLSATVTPAFTGVSVGGRHVCAIANGGLFCWGSGARGQLGLNSAANQSLVTRVGASRDWLQVSAGLNHSCAVRAEPGGGSSLYCWGANESGQLGLGDLVDRRAPTLVRSSAQALRVSAGDNHTCLVEAGVGISCFGQNTYGQLGDGTLVNRSSPVLAASGGWQQVDAGALHTCAIRDDGALFCFGSNGTGRLGDGTGTSRSRPTAVSAGTRWTSVAAGVSHTCGITTSGELRCFGDNSRGQFGMINPAYSLSPLRVPTSNPLAAGSTVTAGTGTCVSPRVFCFGLNGNGEAALGRSIRPRSTVFSAAARYLAPMTMAGTGARHICAIHLDGSLWCSGRNAYTQLGVTRITGRDEFQLVPGPRDWTTISAGANHNCGVHGAGLLACFGSNTTGQLGDGTTTTRTSPTQVPGVWSMVAAGLGHTCAVRTNGDLYCWGQNTSGQLGDGTLANRALPTFIGASYSAVSAGDLHTCAVRANGDVYCWGNNANGQLGNGTVIASPTPVLVASNYQAISAGAAHTCGLSAGALYCWGRNQFGQLGTTGANRNRPSRVGADADWRLVSAAGSHSCAVRGGQFGAAAGVPVDRLFCFGLNTSGELGDGTLTTRFAPTAVGDRVRITSLSAGLATTCMTVATPGYPPDARFVECTGEGSEGGFGDGSAWISSTDYSPYTCGRYNDQFTSCGPYSTCSDDGSCSCNPGTSRAPGLQCGDVDECATNNGGCDSVATCTNILGGRLCACPAGYTGDGLRCVDVDECATNNGGCGPHSRCSNSPGTFACVCDARFTDCDGNNQNGCEDLATDPANCGGCGITCAPGSTCDGRMCSLGGTASDTSQEIVAFQGYRNPIGNFTLGTLTSLPGTGGAFEAFSSAGTDGAGDFVWHDPQLNADQPPRALVSQTGAPTHPFPGATQDTTSVGLQPGATPAILRWSAPTSDIYQVSSSLTDAVDIVTQQCSQVWVCDFWFIWCWSSHYETRCDPPVHTHSSAVADIRVGTGDDPTLDPLVGPSITRYFQAGEHYSLSVYNSGGSSLQGLLEARVSITRGCPAGTGECDGDLSNACEVSLGSNDNCASCGDRCAPSASCSTNQCVCGPGFVGDGHSCADVDECATSYGGCDPNATCSNLPGTYACACNAGFSGDGLACVDVDECLTANGGCDTHASCTNSIGSHTCTCGPGYGGDGTSCTLLCGNGVVDPGEECDDGNAFWDDGCEPDCTATSCSVSKLVPLPEVNVFPGMSGDGHVIATASTLPGQFVDWTRGEVRERWFNGVVSGDGTVFVEQRNSEVVVVDTVMATTSTLCHHGIANDITPDGRFVVFSALDSDLVPGDANNATDVFVHDRVLGRTLRASVNSSGGDANGNSRNGRISADGKVLIFSSEATNLVIAPSTPGQEDVYLYYLPYSGTRYSGSDRLLTDFAGQQLSYLSSSPPIARLDGYRNIYFLSSDPSLPHVAGHSFDLYQRLSQTSVRLVPVPVQIEVTPPPAGAADPLLVAKDGRTAALYGVGGEIYRVDLRSGGAERINLLSDGQLPLDPYAQLGGLSWDGRFASFSSLDLGLRPDPSTGAVYVRQMPSLDCGSARALFTSRQFDRPGAPARVLGYGFGPYLASLRATYSEYRNGAFVRQDLPILRSSPSEVLLDLPQPANGSVFFTYTSSTSTQAFAFSTGMIVDCGDGVLEVGETCDDGNGVNGDSCDNNCTIPACGNGQVDPGEQCDDGNTTNGDNCEADCTLPRCGNRILDRNEDCDDGNVSSGDGCDFSCQDEMCGNGIRSRAPGREACDDGNLLSGDGCDANCTLTGCGNGVVTPGEECDDGDRNPYDACDPNCTLPRCNNGFWDYRTETCDDGTAARDDGCDVDCTPSLCSVGIPSAVCTARAPVRGLGQSQQIILTDGTVWSWGPNYNGAQGLAHGQFLLTPVAVPGLVDVVFTCGGSPGPGYSLAVRADGVVLGAGQEPYVFLDGPQGPRGFEPIAGLPEMSMVSCLGPSAMGLDTLGQVWEWGDASAIHPPSYFGPYDRGPLLVVGVPAIVELDAYLGLAADGGVWTLGPEPYLTLAARPDPIRHIRAGHGITATGQLIRIWDGQMVPIPAPLADYTGFLALDRSGQAYSTDYSTGGLVALNFGAPVRAISGTDADATVLLEDGHIWALGYGDGRSPYSSSQWVQVANFP